MVDSAIQAAIDRKGPHLALNFRDAGVAGGALSFDFLPARFALDTPNCQPQCSNPILLGMTDGAALLAAIAAHPVEDVPRLAYADWLTENGRPEEGEFIRVQCRLASLALDDPEQHLLRLREHELGLWLAAHIPPLHWKLRGGLSIDSGSNWWQQLHRGFPREIELKGSSRARGTFARAAAVALKKLFARIPARWLKIGAVSPGQLADLLREPIIEQLDQLSVWSVTASDEQADEMGRVLANSTNLKNLRGLFLGFAVGESGLEALAKASFPQLHAFSFDASRVNAASLRTLGQSPWFRHLQELTINEHLSEHAFLAALALEPFSRLQALTLREQTFSVSTWDSFARTKAFPALLRLDLAQCNLARGRMAAIASAKGFSLAFLNLDRCAIGNEGATAIARASWTGSLQSLELQQNRISTAGVKALAESPKLANLRRLNLSANTPGIGGLRALAGSPHLARLFELELFHIQENGRGALTAEHGREFLATLNMPELRKLGMSDFPLGQAGATVLATHPKFANLSLLLLKKCQLGDPGAAALIAALHLQNLVELDLEANEIATGINALSSPDVLPHLAQCRLEANRIPTETASQLAQRRGFLL